MKKRLLCILAMLPLLILCSCMSSVNDYTHDEADGFFTRSRERGGELSGALISDIRVSHWLGSERLIIYFSDDGNTEALPSYELIFDNEERTAFTLTIFDTRAEAIKLPGSAELEHISDLTIEKQNGDIVLRGKTASDLKYKITESASTDQLFIDIKEVTEAPEK